MSLRGWGPLNYFLLDHPVFAKSGKQSIASYCNDTILDLSSVNISEGDARDYLDVLIFEGRKDEGRMIRWKQNHKLANEKTNAIDTLKVLTRVTSTQLAVTGDYHLGLDT
jgi:hypothetical protein